MSITKQLGTTLVKYVELQRKQNIVIQIQHW